MHAIHKRKQYVRILRLITNEVEEQINTDSQPQIASIANTTTAKQNSNPKRTTKLSPNPNQCQVLSSYLLF